MDRWSGEQLPTKDPGMACCGLVVDTEDPLIGSDELLPGRSGAVRQDRSIGEVIWPPVSPIGSAGSLLDRMVPGQNMEEWESPVPRLVEVMASPSGFSVGEAASVWWSTECSGRELFR